MSTNHSDWLEEDNIGNAASAKETISKYLSYWPLFIVSLLVCIAAGYLYLYTTTPKYEITESILIKNKLTSPSTNSNAASADLLSIALDGGSTMNIDNETQLIYSLSLMERIVRKNQLNTSYYSVGTFNQTDLYPEAPFHLIQKDSGTAVPAIKIKLDNVTKESATATINAKDSGKVSFNIKWNEPFQVFGGHFILAPVSAITNGNNKYEISWQPVGSMADAIANDLTVSIPDKKTTIIKLSLLAANIEKGKDILNWIVKEYNESSIEEKNTIAQNTLHFIDDRLNIVTSELSGVEGNLEGFQGSSRLVDVQAQASQQLENSNDISKNINDIMIQQKVVDILQNYFNDPATQNKLVPSNLGINDATLISLISSYNELQSKRQREAPQLAANSIVLQDLDNQINNVKTSINENLVNIKKNLQLQETGRRQKDQEYQGFITGLPGKQRVLQDIKRKQSITEGLYLYLLQKREETAISFSTSNASTYKQIDPPKADPTSTWPKGIPIKLGAVLLGLLLPVIFIKIREVLADKVLTQNELTLGSKIPVLAEIVHINNKFINSYPLTASGAGIEQFRSLRTAISLNVNDPRTILVTSGSNADGKTFVSGNLAAVLAMGGKKTALLQFDLQDPVNSSTEKGLVDFLKGVVTDTRTLYTTTPEIAGLHIFNTGAVPENASDLLVSSKLESLFATLKKEYDYIVIDSAATDLVSNAFVLGKYSDIVLLVVRLKYTARKQIKTLNDIADRGSLPNASLIINDI
jgi:capsular exopolysaccharide synthesis family protein